MCNVVGIIIIGHLRIFGGYRIGIFEGDIRIFRVIILAAQLWPQLPLIGERERANINVQRARFLLLIILYRYWRARESVQWSCVSVIIVLVI